MNLPGNLPPTMPINTSILVDMLNNTVALKNYKPAYIRDAESICPYMKIKDDKEINS